MSSFALFRTATLAVGLSSLGCGAAVTSRMPTADDPGTTDTRYQNLDAQLAARLESEHGNDFRVDVTHSFLTDLDNGGVNNDIAGTAIVQHGRRFQSVVFLMTDDGSARFLNAYGAPLDPGAGILLSCDSKPIACPDTFERARRQVHKARFTVTEADAAQPGLEVVVPYEDGSRRIVNSLELFMNPRG